jgi:hypothetical protein
VVFTNIACIITYCLAVKLFQTFLGHWNATILALICGMSFTVLIVTWSWILMFLFVGGNALCHQFFCFIRAPSALFFRMMNCSETDGQSYLFLTVHISVMVLALNSMESFSYSVLIHLLCTLKKWYVMSTTPPIYLLQHATTWGLSSRGLLAWDTV